MALIPISALNYIFPANQNKQDVKFLIREAMHLSKFIDNFFYADKWNIGYANQSKNDFLNRKGLLKIHWLNEENSDHSADPFVLVVNNITFIYYEFLNFWEGRGKIYRIQNFDFTTRELVYGFEEAKIHLSYPYIFRDAGKIYCIPETGEANEVVLYEIDLTNTIRLKKRKTLISGASYIDSSLIKFNQKYWLFTSQMDRRGAFFIYYADTLDSEFMPHALNPILTDQKSFRGAGNLFVDEGVLYRPSQNLEKTYGGSIIISKIINLSEKAYESKPLFEILPASPYGNGIHTISFEENLIVIDGKRKIFSWIMIIKKINKRIKYLIRKHKR